MLKEIYHKNPNSYRIFSREQLLTIKKIQEDIKNDTYTLFPGSLNLSDNYPESLNREKTDTSHVNLCMKLARTKKLFEPFTGSIDYINLEHPTRFGPVDIMIISDMIAYVIELKTTPATHAIIGQVMKYWIGMSLNLILKFYNTVKIITICPGYDENAYKGLKRVNALPLMISENPLSIKELIL